MFRAGTVVRATGGVVVVRCDDREYPEIGMATVDERLEETGQVVDVFGPVERPYLAISPPDSRRVASLVGETVYVRD